MTVRSQELAAHLKTGAVQILNWIKDNDAELSLQDLTVQPEAASSNENYLIFDIETNGLYDEATELFCVAIHDVVRDETIGYGPESIDRAIDGWLVLLVLSVQHNLL